MMNFLKFIISAGVIFFRLYLIYNLVVLLYMYSAQKQMFLQEAGWFLGALILDLYFVNLDNNLGSYIYNKKTDET